MKPPRTLPHAPISALALALLWLATGCGGSEAPVAADAVPQGARRAILSEPTATLQERIVAASRTANSDTNSCAGIRPFYWELGGSARRIVGGSVNLEGDPTSYGAGSVLNLGSASKWLYGAYVVQRKAGELDPTDISMLTLRSGYTSMTECYPYQTVGACYRYLDNETFTPEHEGSFYYDGGHMQRHAMLMGLGPLDRRQLAAEVRSQLGPRVPLRYSLTLVAGGGYATPSVVAALLRKMMNGSLLIGSMLGSNAVCTNPETCPVGQALSTPTPPGESWHYSLGHWVEDDPLAGDGSFSSPGTLGFYPWINADKTIYGLVAREVAAGNGWSSVQCGRQIRKAWQTGQVQPDAL